MDAPADGVVTAPATVSATEFLDSLSASWKMALTAAQMAVRAASAVLVADEVHARSARLSSERTETGRLLEALARDRHLQNWLSDLQLPALHDPAGEQSEPPVRGGTDAEAHLPDPKGPRVTSRRLPVRPALPRTAPAGPAQGLR